MRTAKAMEFANDWEYQQAKRKHRRNERARRQGRRGSESWGQWNEKE